MYSDNMLDVRPYTMLSPACLDALREAAREIITCKIPGVFVQCGVWRGGSAMAVMQEMIQDPRPVYLFDTFDGMTEPGEVDGSNAKFQYEQDPLKVSFTEVRENIAQLGYPDSLIHYISGPVQDILVDFKMPLIALLHLDTDWYDSTKIELASLYPQLAKGGCLIVDDYGEWQGCRKAVDEFIPSAMIERIDRSAIRVWKR